MKCVSQWHLALWHIGYHLKDQEQGWAAKFPSINSTEDSIARNWWFCQQYSVCRHTTICLGHSITFVSLSNRLKECSVATPMKESIFTLRIADNGSFLWRKP